MKYYAQEGLSAFFVVHLCQCGYSPRDMDKGYCLPEWIVKSCIL